MDLANSVCDAIDGYQIQPMPRNLDRNIFKHMKMLIHYGVTQIETLMDMYFFPKMIYHIARTARHETVITVPVETITTIRPYIYVLIFFLIFNKH